MIYCQCVYVIGTQQLRKGVGVTPISLPLACHGEDCSLGNVDGLLVMVYSPVSVSGIHQGYILVSLQFSGSAEAFPMITIVQLMLLIHRPSEFLLTLFNCYF